MTVGQEKAVRTLARGLREDRLSHAYLIVGPRHVGKTTLALDIARAVNCLEEDPPCGSCGQCARVGNGLHADVRVVGLAGRRDDETASRMLIGIDQVREIQRESSLKPYEGRCRVFIIEDAAHLSDEAANCLLKVLEEPPDQVKLLLLALSTEGLLPTIASRCQRLELKPLSASAVAQELEKRGVADRGKADEIARLSKGRLGWAIQAIAEPKLLESRVSRIEAIEMVVQGRLADRFDYAAGMASRFRSDRDDVRQEMEMWLDWWRDVLLIKEGVPDSAASFRRTEVLQEVAARTSSIQVAGVLRAVEETHGYLKRNVNPRLALENLMLDIPSARG